jgi:hypothetical protein
MRMPVTRSLGRKRMARSATKIGTVEFAIAATPESMCFSPQAMSVNGMAMLMRPRSAPPLPVSLIAVTAPPGPEARASTGKSAAKARISRRHIMGAGSRSSTATLMNRYDAPQEAARIPSMIT